MHSINHRSRRLTDLRINSKVSRLHLLRGERNRRSDTACRSTDPHTARRSSSTPRARRCRAHTYLLNISNHQNCNMHLLLQRYTLYRNLRHSRNRKLKPSNRSSLPALRNSLRVRRRARRDLIVEVAVSLQRPSRV